ncbi:MAG: phosphoribosylformylglycinamidine cyclo-ligase [Candidatus Kapabacteria bacterium]|nr:phosphoribosylformylglycinamidine cyclo-ligase [Candidatus Kapabacteria bacterium]
MTYKDSGVDIAAGELLVDKIKPMVRSTFNKNVLTDIGLFGGFYDAKFDGYEHPILVASTDGVGTKLKIAVAANKHNTVGQCLVNHCVNDILCCGARPLFFLDYFATGKLNPDVTSSVIEGFTIACRENSCALIGGETAEMPSMYNDGEYDMSGTIIGVVEKNKIINGKNIAAGDVLIGLRSSGLHTNGYSLARAVLLNKFKVDDYIPEISGTLADSLLAIHRSYLNIITPLLNQQLLNGISHITGGGIIGNTKRIMPKDRQLSIDWQSWQIPPIFNLIQNIGDVPTEDMRSAMNLGIGLILVVSKNKADSVISALGAENPIVIGEVK